MKKIQQILSVILISGLVAGCASKPQPEPAYYRDSAAFRQSISNFAAENDGTDNKITKKEVTDQFGKFDKETKTKINTKDTPVSVYYSQSEEYKSGAYTGKNNRDYFYVFVFEKDQLKRIFVRELSYSIYTGDKTVKIKDRSQGPIEFGIERTDNPKWVSGRDHSILTIK